MRQIIKSQYGASLAMLRDAIRKCSDGLWVDPGYKHRFWHVAYHTVFYADLYLCVSVDDFRPWAKHIDGLESLGPMLHGGGKPLEAGPPYARAEVEEYCEQVMGKVDAAVDAAALDAPSGFPWLPFGKLEMHIYNMRHIQHHAGQVVERIRQNLDEGVVWIGAR